MSKGLGERMVKIETDLEYIKAKQDETNNKLDAFITSADGRYASKDYEKVVKWFGTIIVGAVLVAVLKLVIIG